MNRTPRARSARTDGDDVGRVEGDVLHAGRAVEVEVLLDLALAATLGRLVDRQHDLVVVPDDRRHERGVLGGDLLVVEVGELVEAEHVAVVGDPVVEVALLDVGDDVVEPGDADVGPDGADEVGRLELRGERTGVGGAVEEGVDGVAVGPDGGVVDDAVRRPRPWPAPAATVGAAGQRGVVGAGDVVDEEADVADAVAVACGRASAIGLSGCSAPDTMKRTRPCSSR